MISKKIENLNQERNTNLHLSQQGLNKLMQTTCNKDRLSTSLNKVAITIDYFITP